METEQQDQVEIDNSDAFQLKAEDIEKAESPQTEVDNMNKLNAPPIEIEDSTSSNLNASITAVEININPQIPSNVTLMGVNSLNISQQQCR